MPRPTSVPDWATSGTALKLEPTTNQRQFGWTTDDGTTTGVADKPTIQHQNGWQNAVYQWYDYFDTELASIRAQVEAKGTKYQEFFVGTQSISRNTGQSSTLVQANNLTVGNWYKVSCSSTVEINWGSFGNGNYGHRFDLLNGATNITNETTMFRGNNNGDIARIVHRIPEYSFQATDTTLFYTWFVDDGASSSDIDSINSVNIRMTIEEFSQADRTETTDWT